MTPDIIIAAVTTPVALDVTARGLTHHVLRLYVAGTSPRAIRAIANIRAICDEHLRGCYELEILDIAQQPHLAVAQQIIAAPTLIRHLPLPLRRFIGDLSDIDRIITGLDLRRQAADATYAAGD